MSANRSLAVLCTFALLMTSPTQAGSGALDEAVEAAMDATHVPALGALTMKDGKIDAISVRGIRAVGGSDPARENDVWLINSVAKVMTVAMIARLVERGIIHWNTHLSALLPDLAEGMQPAYRDATLVELLSHRAGLPRDDADLAFGMAFANDPRPLPQQRVAYVTHALKDKPVASLGADAHYSNTGFIIAAVVAEHATGLSYEALMRREVFAPLHMMSAGFGPPEHGLTGHHGGKSAANTNPRMFAPAGAIHMSLRDWAAFALDQLAGAHGRGKLLSLASYRLMQTAQPGSGGVGVDWGVDATLFGRQGPALSHGGSDGNWNTLDILFPASDRGILIATNEGSDDGDKAMRTVLKAMLPDLSPPAPKP